VGEAMIEAAPDATDVVIEFVAANGRSGFVPLTKLLPSAKTS
jgi:hypothetical protein